MPGSRRNFLKQTLLSALSLLPIKCLSSNVLSATGFQELLHQYFPQQTISPTNSLHIYLPDIAENGASVPISIDADLEALEKFYIFAEKNPIPLVAEIQLTPKAIPYFHTRIKIAESSYIIVVAQTDSKWFSTHQWVKVEQGGCGSG